MENRRGACRSARFRQDLQASQKKPNRLFHLVFGDQQNIVHKTFDNGERDRARLHRSLAIGNGFGHGDRNSFTGRERKNPIIC